ncbi:MAG: hypothetical protein GXO04_01250 [Aquificae bacterium]|nr:hypothetical protein [Aquificota bacterium]
MKRFLRNLLPNVVFAEVFFLSLVFLVAGFFLRKEDPLFLKTPYSPSLLLSLIFSLYYGFSGGLSFLAFLALSSLLLYEEFPTHALLWNLLIVLIASEFRYYWFRRIKGAEMERDYAKEQLSRLRKELFLLKLSHDQLEFNYIVKPYSIRGILQELRKKLLERGDERALARFFLNLLSQNFQVYSASIYRHEGGKLKLLESFGEDVREASPEDELVRLALESEETYFLPPKALRRFLAGGGELKHLAVVYAKAEQETFLLTIEDMMFVNLNEEILSYIQILLLYMAEDLAISRKLSKLARKFPLPCPFEFIREYYKMYELYRKLTIHSSVVIFRFPSITPELEQEIQHFIRSLDVVCFVKDKNVALFLLPFTAHVNAQSFANRLRSRYPNAELLLIREVRTPDISEILREAGI